MANVSIQFPERDVQNLIRAMERQSKALGIPMREATQNAAKLVAYSAAAATSESKQYRKYEQVRRPSRTRPGVWRVRSDRPGKKDFTVQAGSVRELKEDRRVKIARRGLAKTTWRTIGAQIPGSSPVASGRDSASARTASQSRKFGTVKVDTNIFNPSVTLTNSLGYARAALKGGESGLNNIVGKAARRMHRMIEAATDKAIKGVAA
jgi:hypothetical protein